VQPKMSKLAAQAQTAEELRKENKALKRELAAKDKHIARLNEKIAKLQKWIGEVKDIIIKGGVRLAALVKDLLKERETVTINSPGAIEKGRTLLDAARQGGAREVKAAGDFFQAVREASLAILIEEMADTHNRKLSLQDARFRYDLDEDPSIASRMKPFRDQRLELGAIARKKGLTVEGKEIKIERGIER
jgi:predicted RNase H-like nuclease (RuvC/YqgF family)